MLRCPECRGMIVKLIERADAYYFEYGLWMKQEFKNYNRTYHCVECGDAYSEDEIIDLMKQDNADFRDRKGDYEHVSQPQKRQTEQRAF